MEDSMEREFSEFDKKLEGLLERHLKDGWGADEIAESLEWYASVLRNACCDVVVEWAEYEEIC